MSNFYELFLASGGRASLAMLARLSTVASFLFNRRGDGPAPPIFLGDNHLRRDLGLPPLDRDGRPV